MKKKIVICRPNQHIKQCWHVKLKNRPFIYKSDFVLRSGNFKEIRKPFGKSQEHSKKKKRKN